MKKSFFLIAALAAPVLLSAQRDELKGLVYRKELSFGLRVPTQGWGIFADAGKFLTVNRSRISQFEFAELKFPKEYKEVGKTPPVQSWPQPKPYFFGKQNTAYALRYVYGRRHLLAEKGERGGVELRATYMAGVSLAVIKPYYIFLKKKAGDFLIPVAEKYSEENKAAFLDIYSVYGSAGFGHGLDELSIIPGAHAKAGLNFDWATYDEFIKAVEVGILADLYIRQVPIMIVEKNKRLFTHLYFSVQFGKRW